MPNSLAGTMAQRCLRVDAAGAVWQVRAIKERKEMTTAQPQQRRRSVPVDVGGVIVGGDAPIVVQSMTNTDTADVDATVAQVAALARSGSEIAGASFVCG